MYHYHLENRREISNISYIQNNRKITKQIIFISPLLLFIAIIGSITIKKNVGIQPSMSRKGNSPDNGMMESFFGILKSEMFYGYEKTFHSLEQLEQAIVDYIDYYNNKHIKVKLKGLGPVQYRTKSFV